jgi:hypothetical protein
MPQYTPWRQSARAPPEEHAIEMFGKHVIPKLKR